MEENFTPDNVKNRLILAGLKELDKHGVVDFSLRRVAIEAGVSCAAPYRHFKDKDELIASIVSYVMEGWTLLSGQISELYSDNVSGLITELAVSGLRFWIANGNFRTVIINASKITSDGLSAMSEFERPLLNAINLYAENGGESKNDLKFRVLSMLYGSITLVDGGYEESDSAAESLRSAILEILA